MKGTILTSKTKTIKILGMLMLCTVFMAGTTSCLTFGGGGRRPGIFHSKGKSKKNSASRYNQNAY
jgi:hypothetical protein